MSFHDPAADRFYAANPDLALFVEAAGQMSYRSEYLEMTSAFWERVKSAFPVPDYTDEGIPIPGSVGLLSGISVVIRDDLDSDWRIGRRPS